MRWLVDARPLVDPRRGGVSRVARRLVAALAARTSEHLTLATTGSRAQASDTLPHGMNTEHVHLAMPNKIWSTLSLLRTTSLDQAVAHRVGASDALFLPNLGFVGTPRIPYTLLLHDLSFLIEPAWFPWRMRLWHRAVGAKRLIKNAAHLFCVSRTTARDAERLFNLPASRLTILPIGPTLDEAAATASPPPSSRFILALGQNDPRKNTATALKAVEILKNDPAFADLKIIIANGKQTDAELQSLYAHAAAFAYPSWYEGFGLPLHEAARFGTPRIASSAGALPDTAPPGTVFADPAKPHHWAEALRLAISHGRTEPIQRPDTLWNEAADLVAMQLRKIA